MNDDIEKLCKLLDKNFKEKNVGEKMDLVIRTWLNYLDYHIKIHPCNQIKEIAIIRASQILALVGGKK